MNSKIDKGVYAQLKQYCIKNRLIERGDGIVAGISGGADSVFLFLFLCELKEEYDLNLCMVHVNHGIRGAEAKRDEDYVVKLASEYGEKCRVYTADIPEMARKSGMTEEEAGRQFRYECFEQVRQEIGYNTIAVAHHQDDQAETILFQMLRGSGLRGMGGMRPRNGVIVRPMLDIRRKDIENQLKKMHIYYCTDSTNEQDEYSRNQIRHHVIPYLQEHIQPATVSHLAGTATQLRDASDYIDMQSHNIYANIVHEEAEGLYVDVSELKSQHIVIQREVLMMMMEHVAGRRKDLTSTHVENLIDILTGTAGRRIDLPYGMCAVMEYGRMWIGERESDIAVEVDNEVMQMSISNGNEISYTDGTLYLVSFMVKNGSEVKDIIIKNNCTKWFDYARIKTMPEFRHPKEGDYLWLKPQGARKKLSRILIDSKIPANKRREMWVMADGDHIMWIPELDRCSAYYYIDETTREVLCAEACAVS